MESSKVLDLVMSWFAGAGAGKSPSYASNPLDEINKILKGSPIRWTLQSSEEIHPYLFHFIPPNRSLPFPLALPRPHFLELQWTLD